MAKDYYFQTKSLIVVEQKREGKLTEKARELLFKENNASVREPKRESELLDFLGFAGVGFNMRIKGHL